MKTLVSRGAAIALLVLVCSAHIGSPDAWYEGPAGAYHVLVHVEAPTVVPGIAIINVKVSGADRVTAFINKFDATGGTPPPDVAAPIPNSPDWYRTKLWVMAAGSNGVNVSITGAKGEGSVVVPLTAVARSRLTFGGPLAAVLVLAGVFLVVGLLTIVGAMVREAVLPPGVEPDVARRRRARIAIARTGIVVAAALIGMGVWWRAADAGFASELFRPLSITTRVEPDAAPPRLTFTIDDSVWKYRDDNGGLRARGQAQLTRLIEDHGKLVHLFLLAEDGRSAFAHLHPTTSDTVTFTAALPPLPPGTYRMFADVVHESGFTETLTSRVVIPSASDASGTRLSADADDSWRTAPSSDDSGRAVLEDGAALKWIRNAEPLTANAEAGLRFAVELPRGDTVAIEPYLGMAGHAAVVRDDGSVFIHLHPLGTVSLAAQSRLVRGTTAHDMAAMTHPSGRIQDTIYFPYAFPQHGKYTVWVQVKRRGRVLTGAFAMDVAPAKP